MRYIVSACLMGANCKYNGGNNYQLRLSAFLKNHTFRCVCPEVLGGLPTPRLSVEIQNCGGIKNHSRFSAGRGNPSISKSFLRCK